MTRSAIVRIASLATLCFCVPLSAAEPFDMSALMGAPAQTVEATVFLVPAELVYHDALDEAAVRRVGCRYTVADAGAIRPLIGLIAAAALQSSPLFQKPDVRAVVHFVHTDGMRIDLHLQDNFGGKLPVIGVVETSEGGGFRTVPITARPTLMTDLRAWAERHGGPGEGNACRVPRTVPANTGLPKP